MPKTLLRNSEDALGAADRSGTVCAIARAALGFGEASKRSYDRGDTTGVGVNGLGALDHLLT